MSDSSVIYNPEPIIRRPELRRSSAVSTQGNASNECHRSPRPVTVSYELSEDIRAKEVEFIERRYGGRFASQRAAKIIQSTYREYQLRKDYDKLKIEKRVSRKLDLPYINHGNQSMFRSPTSPTSPEIIKISKKDLKKQNSYEDLVIEQAYKDWSSEPFGENNKSFKRNEQNIDKKLSNVDSGAESIETSSVSLTPSPTATTNFSSALVTSIECTSESSTIKRDNCDSNTSTETIPSSENIKKSIASHNYSICDNKSSPDVSSNLKSTKTSNLTICTDLNNSAFQNSFTTTNCHIMTYSTCSPPSSAICCNNSNFNFQSKSQFSTAPIAGYLSNPRLIGCKFPKSCFCHTVNDRKHRRLYRICLNIFNKNAVKGVSFLIRYRFVEPQPHLLAKFLMTRKGISRISIGDYLGQTKDQFALDTLKYFTRMVDMKNKDIDVALRHLLSFFQIPGESQKIKQIVEEFQESYVEQNVNWNKTFRNPDTIMLLAYAIIMLHTDMYNPNVRKNNKMTKDGFIHNFRNVDDGYDIDSELLGSIYDRIKLSEIKTFSDHTNQVRKIDQHFNGNLRPSNLVQTHRRLVCYCRLYEVADMQKKERIGAHQREVFLFNDLLVITKSIQKRKKDGVVYQCRRVISLNKLQVYLFESILYPCGIQLKWDEECNVMFNTRTLSDRKKFIDDLMETICEVREMDRIRIEEELLKQHQEEQQQHKECDSTHHHSSQIEQDQYMASVIGHGIIQSQISANQKHQLSTNQCLHTSRCPSIDHHTPLSNFVMIRQSDTGNKHASIGLANQINNGALIGQITEQHYPMTDSMISDNAYNQQYRISGDSGLQEDIE